MCVVCVHTYGACSVYVVCICMWIVFVCDVCLCVVCGMCACMVFMCVCGLCLCGMCIYGVCMCIGNSIQGLAYARQALYPSATCSDSSDSYKFGNKTSSLSVCSYHAHSQKLINK